MGADTFIQAAKGKTAQEAFASAVAEAQYQHGHGGYTGTLAQKHDFVQIAVPADKEPRAFAGELIEASDPRIDDKWGPAGCIALSDGLWLFFGWASS